MAPLRRAQVEGSRDDPLRLFLVVFAVLLTGASLAAYVTALSSGTIGVRESVALHRAVAEDPLVTAWVPALAGVFIAIGLLTRSTVSWAALTVLSIYAVFFLPSVGWIYMFAAIILAGGLAWLPPLPGRPRWRRSR